MLTSCCTIVNWEADLNRDQMDDSEIQNKLAAARTRLILDKPFLGALVLRLPLVEAKPDWCKTVSTDAKKLYFNKEYVEALRPAELQFVLAKQALHCALSHVTRRAHRVAHRWQLACDYAVNPLLVEDGLTPPPDALFDDLFAGMTAEEIYPCLQDKDDADQDQSESEQDPQNQNSDVGDSNSDLESSTAKSERDDSAEGGQGSQQDDEANSDDQGASKPAPLSRQEQEALDVQWQQRMAGAAQQAQQAGKLSKAMQRLVDFMLQPKLPWRVLLAQYMVTTARDDYSYTRPTARRGDPAILPSLRSQQVQIVVGLDVSGSITDDEINEFLSEIDAIKGQLRARISLLACDAQLVEGTPWHYEPWEEFKLPEKIAGGGGTDFRPVFDWVAAQDMAPNLLIYFSDCIGKFPQQVPHYPVIWLVKGRQQPPFGQCIRLN